MQTLNEQLKQQQLILKSLSYYQGKIDGLWGPKSIEAKQAFERSGKFNPGLPSSGLPFGSKGPYPKGISLGPKGLLQLEGANLEALAQASQATTTASKTPTQQKKSAAPETPIDDTPTVT